MTTESRNAKLTMLIWPPILGAGNGSEANAFLVETVNPWALAGWGDPNFIPFKVIVVTTPVPEYNCVVSRDNDWAPKDDKTNWALAYVGVELLSKNPFG